jgi:cyclohexanone monooxygenase
MQYSYSFDDALDQEWSWSEKYSPQPEILDYANHVADRYELRRDIQFNTRVTATTFDEATQRWSVKTDQGDRVSAQFCVMTVGCLSAANRPDFAGVGDFQGSIYHTGEWPHEGVDLNGKRVAIIGTGSSAIQTIPIIAAQAKTLTVFQRTASYTVPARNAKLDPEVEAAMKADYPAFRAKARMRPSAVYFLFNAGSALDATSEEREQQYEEFWARGGLPFLGAYGDLLFEKEANDTIAEFAQRKIRKTVEDPATAALLSPDKVLGCKRLCVDTGYYETYNQPHVRLVDVSKEPIGRITRTGLVANGEQHEVDVIICATGFAAMAGSFEKIKITGRGGLTLTKKWEARPGSPSVLASMIQSIGQHADWMVDCFAHMRDIGAKTIEPVLQNEDDWVDHVNDVAEISLRSTGSSWYVGANIPG